ncbi:MAG: carboxypeptidase-like regulatory domain-containing protein [Bacteroidales bacterium]
MVLLCSGLQILVAQTVTGTVSSARDGQTLPGVTAQIKGNMTGTATDVNGNYSINIQPYEKVAIWRTCNIFNPCTDEEFYTNLYMRSHTKQII